MHVRVCSSAAHATGVSLHMNPLGGCTEASDKHGVLSAVMLIFSLLHFKNFPSSKTVLLTLLQGRCGGACLSHLVQLGLQCCDAIILRQHLPPEMLCDLVVVPLSSLQLLHKGGVVC
jgi:hypothetical protein